MRLTEYLPHVVLVIEIAYFIAIILLAGKIIMDTKNTAKTLAYLLLIVFLPLVGIIIYFVFGVNYRKNTFYTFKLTRNEEVYQRVKRFITEYHEKVVSDIPAEIKKHQTTFDFIFNGAHSPLTGGNHVQLLINGEEKFLKVFEIIGQAKHHIHLEYYIFENDMIGNALGDLLIEKAGEGVKVRLLYDDFGSNKIGKHLLARMKAGGIEISPVNRIKFKLLANRVNYRDHRKIIIADGKHVFSGGINVSDRYINPNSKTWWRDTHFYLRGNGAAHFQFLFLTTWYFATGERIPDIREYFNFGEEKENDQFVQVVPSGPDVKPFIMLSTTSSIYEARKRIYITTPYFIPVESVINAIKTQALAGLDVRLIVPMNSDSVLVNAAAYSYFSELLKNGVRIFLYRKGFIHAKTMLIDDVFCCIGTANMDVRSQELNFEVNTHIYNRQINQKMFETFLKDQEDSVEIDINEWQNRSSVKVFFEHLARLFSPLI